MKPQTKSIILRIKRMKEKNLNPFSIMESIYYDFPKMTERKIFELVMKTK